MPRTAAPDHPADHPADDPADLLTDLRALLPGRVLDPTDADWELAHRAWVVNVAQEPLAVVGVSGVDDVCAVVHCAARHGAGVAAQPVGHGATTALSGAVLLRTASLQEVDVDVERRVARVGAGVKWGTLLAALEPTGLVALAGSTPDPSVVGFTLGGGLSWFGRAHGLAAHSVVAFDVVGADGVLRRVDGESDPELFWALRGGGGDLGVVTALELRLFDAPGLHGGRLLWPIEMAGPVLSAYRALTRQAPDELTAWAQLLRLPPAPMVPEPLRGRAFVSVDVTLLGAADELDAHLAPLRAVPGLEADTVGPLPLSRLGDVVAEPVDPMPTEETSALLADLDEDDLARLVDVAGAGCDLPLVIVQLRHLGGALSRAAAEDGPNAAITESYQLFALGVPMAPEQGPAIEAAFAAVHGAVASRRTGRVFFNFQGHRSDLSRAFAPGALERLRRVKLARDPASVFRSNRPLLG